MLCFLFKCCASYAKNLSDTIIAVICSISSLTGTGLIVAKYNHVKLIDEHLSWAEVIMPVAVGTGGCIVYHIVCYGINGVFCPTKKRENLIELV